MKNSKLFIRIVSIVLLIAMCLTLILPIFVSADTKTDFEQAQEELNRIEKELNSIKNEAERQKAQKKKAMQQVDLVRKQISAMRAEITKLSEELTEKQEQLDAKKKDIKETDDLFKARLNAMYKMRTGGSVATILGVESFSEFLTAAKTLQNISQADTDLLKKLDEEKKEYEKQEQELKAKLETLEANRKLQEKKEGELAGLLKQVNDKLTDAEADLESKQQEWNASYAEYSAAKKAMEEEFGISGGTGDFVGGEWAWPVPASRHISSRFGWRTLYGRPDYHTGIDIARGSLSSLLGSPIVASNSGYVTVATYASTGYGNRVMIDHGGGYKTLYGHCSSLNVSVGQFVGKGDIIAYVGSTGNSTGPHLHFEIRVNDQKIDPEPLLRG